MLCFHVGALTFMSTLKVDMCALIYLLISFAMIIIIIIHCKYMLGVTIRECEVEHTYIDKAVSKANGMLGLICRDLGNAPAK